MLRVARHPAGLVHPGAGRKAVGSLAAAVQAAGFNKEAELFKHLSHSQKPLVATLLAASGTSFVAELNATRLDRASDLLSDPRSMGLPVADVAFRTGFLDPGYFTRLFRKRFGITPREWRSGHAPQS